MCLYVCMSICLYVCLCGCVSSNFLQIATSTFIGLIFTKLGTHDLCANAQKAVKQTFEILTLKFLAIFV